MKPTDPVAAPLLPEEKPCYCIPGKLGSSTNCPRHSQIGAFAAANPLPESLLKQLHIIQGANGLCACGTDGKTCEEMIAPFFRTPLPPRADWALEKAELESRILVLQTRLGQGQEESQGPLATEAQQALASLQENPEWNQWVNAIYSEPRFNAPHRMSHIRALEMAALLFLRHAPEMGKSNWEPFPHSIEEYHKTFAPGAVPQEDDGPYDLAYALPQWSYDAALGRGEEDLTSKEVKTCAPPNSTNMDASAKTASLAETSMKTGASNAAPETSEPFRAAATPSAEEMLDWLEQFKMLEAYQNVAPMSLNFGKWEFRYWKNDCWSKLYIAPILHLAIASAMKGEK